MNASLRSKYLTLLLVFLCLTSAYPLRAVVIYVDANATGANDGLSWTDAFKYLQNALSMTLPGSEIRVAQGTYKPDIDNAHPNGTNDRTATFQLKNSVAIYGGYPHGGGTRDPNIYKSILSGDINVPYDNNDNSYHVVTASGIDSNAILDGFTITAGNANGSAPDSNNGAGLYNLCNSAGSPTVINCTFSGNSSTNHGGGMYNYQSSPTVTNCTFSNNSITRYGGGICNYKSTTAIVTNCTFIGNSAWHGSGMCNFESSPIVTNCTFNSNTSINDGCAMYNYFCSPTIINCIFSGNEIRFSPGTAYGGAMFNNYSSPTLTNCKFISNSVNKFIGDLVHPPSAGGMYNYFSSPTLNNCIFIDNSAEYGGGMYNNNSDSNIVNCEFSGNSADSLGGGMCNYGSISPTVTNCILWGNTAPTGPQIYNSSGCSATVSFSDVQGGWAGTGNINADPCFVTGPDGDYFLSQIAAGQAFDSPCVDTGSDTAMNLGMDMFTTRTDGSKDKGIVDMGYHYSRIVPVCSADIYKDWHVDFLDFALLAADWLQCSDPFNMNCTEVGLLDGDIVQDYYVNSCDREYLVSCWLDCYVTEAADPQPSDGVDLVDPNNTVLEWSAGDGAIYHDVYLGTDSVAVANAGYLSEEFKDMVSETSFDPGILDINTTYYWRIDEIGPACSAKGTVWSFTTWSSVIIPSIGWWKFDDGNGTIAYDSAGDNNGILVNGPVWTTGRIDGALSFDGVDDYVDLGNSSSLKLPLPVTISAWIKLDTLGVSNGILSLDTPLPTHYGIRFYVDLTNRLFISYGDGGGSGSAHRRSKQGSTALVADKWYHVAAVLRGPTDMDLYINAVDNGGTYSGSGGSLAYSAGNSFIGCNTDNISYPTWFNGKIDDVHVYDRALSAKGIQQLYQDGL